MDPTPFQKALAGGNAFARGQAASRQKRKDVREGTALDNILQNAIDSEDPKSFDRAIGQILQTVSADNRAPALKILNDKRDQLEQQKIQKQQQQADVSFGLTEQETKASPDVRKERVKTIGAKNRVSEILERNQTPSGTPRQISDLSEEELVEASGIPGVGEPFKQELQKIQAATKEDRADRREARKETAAIKSKIIQGAESAREGIRNGNQLLATLESGNLTDPTAAALLDSLPFNLGQRFLSNDAVVYRANLINQYKGLRQIFQGQTRVKEIELLEQKIPDLYLTDSQKKRIIENNVETLQWDILKEQAALEVEQEFPDVTALQFNSKVNQKMSSAANKFIDDQRSVIDEAEAFKDVLLDINNSEHFLIMQQMQEESDGDPDKAIKIGHEKGYKFLGIDG
jgi:hypothetical protein